MQTAKWKMENGKWKMSIISSNIPIKNGIISIKIHLLYLIFIICIIGIVVVAVLMFIQNEVQQTKRLHQYPAEVDNNVVLFVFLKSV